MATAGNWFPAGYGNERSSLQSLERLPDSIICEFLQNLDLKSLCAAACVSRTLRSAADQVLASLSSFDLLDSSLEDETLQLIVGRLKGVKSVTFDCLRADDFNFINMLGSQIQELNLLKCSSQFQDTLITIGTRFPNLRVISIELAGQEFPELIAKNLGTMIKELSYLESLSFKLFQFEREIYIRIRRVLHYVHLLFLPKTLKSLKLDPVDQHHFIHSIAPTVTNLRVLSLVLDNISDQLMFSITMYLPSLVELVLEDRPEWDPPMHLDLTNAGLQSLRALKQLSVLSITRKSLVGPAIRFYRVNDTGVRNLFGSCSGLESVKLDGFEIVTDAGYSAILRSCPRLKKLELRNADLLSDLTFHNVKEVANSLVELRLSSLSRITSEALKELPSFCKLEVLDLSYWDISNHCLSYISILSTLTSLSLAGSDITDEGLAILGSQSSIITSLCLANCNSISEKGIHKLFHGEGQIGNGLLCLDIGFIYAISDAAIATISSSAKALTDLCLSACSAVTDAAVEMLASRGMSNDGSTPLRRLNLNYCMGLSDGLVGIFDTKAFFSGLHWLGIRETHLCSRRNEFEDICASRRWLTVCFDACHFGCHNKWMCHYDVILR